MAKLVEILKKETESLKIQYLEMTEGWAVTEFNQLRQWASDYSKGKFGYGEASKKYYRLPHYIINSYGTVDMHVKKMIELANEHYENSILKLATRIEKKGLVVDNISVKTSHIGVNIETILTDGVKTVRAFTVIAGGPVQKPHYRYLIK